MRLWSKRKPKTYYIGGGRDLHGRDLQPGGTTIRVTDDQPRPDWARWFGIGLATVAAIGLVLLVSWAIIAFAGPTQRERDRANIARQEVEITQLRQRIDSLSLRLDELERR